MVICDCVSQYFNHIIYNRIMSFDLNANVHKEQFSYLFLNIVATIASQSVFKAADCEL